MTNSPTSRRTFLSNLAILSVGTAFGNVPQLFPNAQPATDLQAQWKKFCHRLGGQPTSSDLFIENQTLLPGKGHWHEPGSLICFADHQLMAQPTWIYWTEKKTKPADVVITFYNASGDKLFRLNRFELEALTRLGAKNTNSDILALLQANACYSRTGAAREKAPLTVKAKIAGRRQVHLQTLLHQQETTTIHRDIVHI